MEVALIFVKKLLGMSSDILDKLTVRLGTNLEKIYVMRLFKIKRRFLIFFDTIGLLIKNILRDFFSDCFYFYKF